MDATPLPNGCSCSGVRRVPSDVMLVGADAPMASMTRDIASPVR
jgi:hypothetical protein